MKLADKQDLLMSERQWPMTDRERAQLERRLEVLYQIRRMDVASNQEAFNRALLDYICLKEGVEL